jgi:hypothetical protein
MPSIGTSRSLYPHRQGENLASLPTLYPCEPWYRELGTMAAFPRLLFNHSFLMLGSRNSFYLRGQERKFSQVKQMESSH